MARVKPPRASPNGQPVPSASELRAEELELAVDQAALGFATTAELEPLEGAFGQERALRALELGLGVRQPGYNVYLCADGDGSRMKLARRHLEGRASQAPAPDDWAYVHNFDEPDRPLALRLPAGHGARLRGALERLVETLRRDMPAELKARGFDAEQERLQASYGAQSDALFDQLTREAREAGLALERLPNGGIFVPLRQGKPLPREQLELMSPAEQEDYEGRLKGIHRRAGEILERQRELLLRARGEIQGFVRACAARLIEAPLAQAAGDRPDERLKAWLARVRDHALDHLEAFESREEAPVPPGLRGAVRADPLLVYRVNVVADHSRHSGAPVVVEPSPNYKNLFGTIEHDVTLLGQLSTDFTRIKPGSLLRANGGYLVFDLADALTEPLVWKQLKRTLKSGQLLTDVYEPLALLSASALKPEPIPLDVKLVVLGPPRLYHLLQFADEEFRDLFKVRAELGPETERGPEAERAYARFLARQARDEHLPPFGADAVAEVIRHGARLAGHRQRLSLDLEALGDLASEAGFWARQAGAETVGAGHVRQALDERDRRNGRLAEEVRRLVREGALRISLFGRRVGQVNGLAVLDLGDFRFARPCRVTASVGVGREGLINVERESELAGGTHNKGVLILEGYLRNRYARRHPLALSASLALEQSYGWVEGDSASAAELFCLLSAIAGVGLRQDVAVTGSVNQHGDIQAVGGINEKVEGFFDVCRLAGLTGTQGVCLPRSNLPQLMPRPDVVEAVRKGEFHVWAIDTVDEGIELLTGLPAGDVDQQGAFHHRLDQRARRTLALLREEPAAAVRAGRAQAEPPAPTLPPLPGDTPEPIAGEGGSAPRAGSNCCHAQCRTDGGGEPCTT